MFTDTLLIDQKKGCEICRRHTCRLVVSNVSQRGTRTAHLAWIDRLKKNTAPPTSHASDTAEDHGPHTVQQQKQWGMLRGLPFDKRRPIGSTVSGTADKHTPCSTHQLQQLLTWPRSAISSKACMLSSPLYIFIFSRMPIFASCKPGAADPLSHRYTDSCEVSKPASTTPPRKFTQGIMRCRRTRFPPRDRGCYFARFLRSRVMGVCRFPEVSAAPITKGS